MVHIAHLLICMLAAASASALRCASAKSIGAAAFRAPSFALPARGAEAVEEELERAGFTAGAGDAATNFGVAGVETRGVPTTGGGAREALAAGVGA